VRTPSARRSSSVWGKVNYRYSVSARRSCGASLSTRSKKSYGCVPIAHSRCMFGRIIITRLSKSYIKNGERQPERLRHARNEQIDSLGYLERVGTHGTNAPIRSLHVPLLCVWQDHRLWARSEDAGHCRRLSFAKIRRDLVSGEKSPRDVDQDSTFGCAECGMTKELDAEKDGQGGWRESRSRQRP